MLHIDTREKADIIHRPLALALGCTTLCQPDAVRGKPWYSADCQHKSIHKLGTSRLGAADFCLFDKDGHSMGIERKAGGDFFSSLSGKHRMANGNKRLFDQLARLKDEYDYAAICLEGIETYNTNGRTFTLGNADSGWLWGSVEMMMWGWIHEGLMVFRSPCLASTVELLRLLNQRAEKGCVLPRQAREEYRAA